MKHPILQTFGVDSLDSVLELQDSDGGTVVILTVCKHSDSLTLTISGKHSGSILEVKECNGCLHITLSSTDGY